MTAVDTNILIYLHDPRDAGKQSLATHLVASLTDGVLLWQVACEYFAATRKLAAYGVKPADVLRSFDHLSKGWQLARPEWRALKQAAEWVDRHSVSFWDAMILAACIEAGVTTLYSEDIRATMVPLKNLSIINPF